MRFFVGALCAIVVIYLAVSAYAGYRVGSAIADAKRNPLVAVGSHLVGRDRLERYAVSRSKLPAYITESPSFWAALRASE